MQMSKQEIYLSYKNSRNKGEQIKILSQLNACDINAIKDILLEKGISYEELFPASNKQKVKGGEIEVMETTKEKESIISSATEVISDASGIADKKRIGRPKGSPNKPKTEASVQTLPNVVTNLIRDKIDLLENEKKKHRDIISQIDSELSELKGFLNKYC